MMIAHMIIRNCQPDLHLVMTVRATLLMLSKLMEINIELQALRTGAFDFMIVLA